MGSFIKKLCVMLPVLQLRFMRFSRFRFDCIGNLHVGILPYLLVPTLPSKYAEYGLLLTITLKGCAVTVGVHYNVYDGVLKGRMA